MTAQPLRARWPGPWWPGAARRRAGRLVRRAAVAGAAILIVVTTGTGWWQTRGISQAEVIGPSAAAAGGPAVDQNILVVGLDSRTDAQGRPLPPEVLAALHAGSSADGGNTTDTLIVVHVPADGGRATAISVPRDAYVPLADGLGTHKINSAYAGGALRARAALVARGVGEPELTVQADAQGARTTVATVSSLLGLPITHVAAVNLAAVDAVSRVVGGVPVCLRGPVDDPYSGARFPAGPQTVSGPAALAFVRQRHGLPGGDLDRIHRQQAFLAGLSRTLLDAGTLSDPARLTGLLAAVRQNVTLDQGWDLVRFAQQMAGLRADAVGFATVPSVNNALATPEDGSAVEVDPPQVRAAVASLVAPPAPPAAPATTPAAPVTTAEAPTPVDVHHGSDHPGLAAAGPPPLTAAATPCVD